MMRIWVNVDNECSAPSQEEVGKGCCRISLQNLLLRFQCHGQLYKGIHKILMQRFELKSPCEITVLSQPNNALCNVFWARMVFSAQREDLGCKHQPQLLFQICMRKPLGSVPHLKDQGTKPSLILQEVCERIFQSFFHFCIPMTKLQMASTLFLLCRLFSQLIDETQNPAGCIKLEFRTDFSSILLCMSLHLS